MGEICVESQSASLLSILDLSSENIITCPKLKSALLKAKSSEPIGAQKEAVLKNAAPLTPNSTAPFSSPFLLLARNRLRLRRTTDSEWMTDSLSGSKAGSPQRVRRLSQRSTTPSESGSRSRGSSGVKGKSPPAKRGGTYMMGSKSSRKRSNSSLHFLQRKSSLLSSVYASRESEIDGVGTVSWTRVSSSEFINLQYLYLSKWLNSI